MRKLNLLLLAFVCLVTITYAREITGKEAQQQIKGAEKIVTGNRCDLPEIIHFRKEAQPEFVNFSAWAHENFKLSDDNDFILLNADKDPLGYTHYRFRETYKGIPLMSTMYVVHVQNNRIVSMNGQIFKKLDVNVHAELAEQTALTAALNYTNASVYRWQVPFWEQQIKYQKKDNTASWYPAGELFLAPAHGKFQASEYRLAYRFDIYSEQPLKREYVYVDAITGEIIFTQNRIMHSNVVATAQTAYSGLREIVTDSVNATTYRLREANRGAGQGIETYDCQQGTAQVNNDFFDADNYWNNVNGVWDEYATDAHWGGEMTYDYYWQKFLRNSIDNNGMMLYSYVHYDVGYVNAFWDGTEMTYGDGNGGNPYHPLTSLEIAGHEISHGVTELTSGLEYMDESGALNEGFSDCMGNSIRWYGKPGASIDWLIGNEIGGNGNSFRDMANPHNFNNPECYGNGDNFWNAPNEVHNNSGVLNHWYYLLTEGGSGTNCNAETYNVTGIGINKSEQICYRMNTVYLTPTSTYADARMGAIQAAIDLYGPCTPEVMATTNAWHAVGVGNEFVPVVISDFDAPTVTYCSAPATVNFINQSTNGGSFIWDFGDGDTSHVTSPVHTYTGYGSFTVTLIADGGSCGIDTMIQTQFIDVDTLNPCILTLPENGTATTQTGCAGTLYDSGGQFANYQDNTDAKVTIAPIGANTVTLTFTSFNMESGYDYLYIYDGPTTASPQVPGSPFSGNSLPGGGTITSTYSSLTLRQTSDVGLTFSGFEVNWQCALSTLPPIANFTANTTNTCSGIVQFTDMSTQGPTSWSWDFGDGGNSTLQSPSHTYSTNGVYTVTLIATNGNGNDTHVMTNYITVNLPATPTATGATVCQGSSAALNANGNGTLTWFNVPNGGVSIGTGPVFNTPPLVNTTNYYVESQIFPATGFNTPHDNLFGGGNYYQGGTYRALVFDCAAPVTLVSVKVYSDIAQSKTITLRVNGNTVNTMTVNVPTGSSRVTLNWQLPVGTNLELGSPDGADLFRNNSGAAPPYTYGPVSITGTTAGALGYYYFFYDWEIQDLPCISARIPVTATMTPGPTSAFTENIFANLVDFIDNSTGNPTSWSWDFGDGNTSTLQSPSHAYANVGSYTVCLTTVNANGCSHQTCQYINILSVGIEEGSVASMISVYPNPVSDQLHIKFNDVMSKKNWSLKLTDLVGQVVEEKAVRQVDAMDWNLAGLAPGSYILTIENGEDRVIRRIVRQ